MTNNILQFSSLFVFYCTQHGRQFNGESPLWGLVLATISQRQSPLSISAQNKMYFSIVQTVYIAKSIDIME